MIRTAVLAILAGFIAAVVIIGFEAVDKLTSNPTSLTGLVQDVTVKATPIPTATADEREHLGQQLFFAVNGARAAHGQGLTALEYDGPLSGVAQTRAEELAAQAPTSIDQEANRQDIGILLAEAGLSGKDGVEVTTKTPSLMEDTVKVIQSSPGFQENALDPNYTSIGVGAAQDVLGNWYCVLIFVVNPPGSGDTRVQIWGVARLASATPQSQN